MTKRRTVAQISTARRKRERRKKSELPDACNSLIADAFQGVTVDELKQRGISREKRDGQAGYQ